jgi:chaperonin cofactor prefoldin
MGPSDRLVRAVTEERATLERQRAQLAREADALRASLKRIEAGLSEIDALTARLDDLAPRTTATPRPAPAAPDPREDGPNTLRGPAIREVAVALLVADGRDALHYRAWFDLLTQAGYDVAGKDPLAVFLTQITRSPAVRKGARPGEYALDRDARATHESRLRHLNQRLAALPSQTSDLTELRSRRAQLTTEITKVEKALEELQKAAA